MIDDAYVIYSSDVDCPCVMDKDDEQYYEQLMSTGLNDNSNGISNV